MFIRFSLYRLLRQFIPVAGTVTMLAACTSAQDELLRSPVAPIETPSTQESSPSESGSTSESSESGQEAERCFFMASDLAGQGLYDDAIQQFWNGLKQPRRSATARQMVDGAMFGLASSYFASDRPEMALHTLLRLHHHIPDHTSAYRLRARVHRSLGQHRAEREALIRCLELCPDDWSTRLELARAFLDAPECSPSHANHAMSLLGPILKSGDPAASNVYVYETLAIAAALDNSWELATASIQRALAVTPAETRARIRELQERIRNREDLREAITWEQSVRSEAELRELIFGSVLIVHLEGRLRITPDGQNTATVESVVTREMPAVVVGSFGDLLVSARLLETPKNQASGKQAEWAEPPKLTLSRWNAESGSMESLGTAIVEAVDEPSGFGLLAMVDNRDLDPLTGVKGLRTARIAADYFLDSPPANTWLHYAEFQVSGDRPVVHTVTEQDLAQRLLENQVPDGAVVFNDFGEIVAMIHERSVRIPGAEELAQSYKDSCDCSYAFSCLSAYGKIPRKRFPFEWRQIPLSDNEGDSDHQFGLEVTRADQCSQLQIGDVVITINDVPVTDKMDFDLLQNLFVDYQENELRLELTGGRRVVESFRDDAKNAGVPAVSQPDSTIRTTDSDESTDDVVERSSDRSVERELSRTEMANEHQQSRQFEEWLHDNIKDPELARQLIETQEAVRTAGKNYILRCGALACRNQQSWIVSLQNGNFAAHPVSESLAATMGIQPGVVDGDKNGMIISQGDVVFRISRVQITPVEAEDNPVQEGHKIRIKFRIETLSAPDFSKKQAICVRTSKGLYRSTTVLEKVAGVGEAVNYELAWPDPRMPALLEDADLLMLQMVTYEGDNVQDLKTSSDCWSQIVSFAAPR
jgi:tetratricopeptide (TPR) repeat protein